MKRFRFFLLVAFYALLTCGVAIAAPDPNFYVFLCFGQSNMEGQGTIESQDRTVDSRFVMMSSLTCGSRKQGEWYTATPPLARCDTKLGPVDYFGRTLVKNLPENIKIGVITVAVAGCDIQLFEKDNYKSYVSSAQSWMQSSINQYGGNPYGRLIEAAKKAQEDGVIKGILLHQGETNTGQQNWPNRVKGVYDNIIKDLGLNAADVPLLAGEVVRTEQGGSCGSMNSIIAKLPNTISNAHVVSAEGLGHQGDNLHFTSASYRTLGERYANKMLSLLDVEPGGEGGTTTPSEPSVDRQPYKGEAQLIPGTVEAENYDEGGSGEAYYDTDSQNEGNEYRNDGVDVVSVNDGYAVGYTTSDEWLEYTVEVEEDGKYVFEAVASNGNTNIDIDLLLDGKEIATISGSATADWDTYSTIRGTTSSLSAGKHVLRVKFGTNYNNLDFITFYSEEDAPALPEKPENPSPSVDPGVYPLSYPVENTGAGCEDPSSLKDANLKSCTTLPDPFEWADGSGRVTDFCDWACRRNEIKREIEHYEIGEKPTFDNLTASYSNGTLTVKITNGSNTLTLTSKISIPSGSGPHPIVVGMDGNTGSLSASLFSKCIQVPFTHSQIAEYNSGFGGGGRSQNDPFYKLYPGTFNTKADYCAWSWGISRIIDGLEIVKEQINADISKIAVTGCSYAGKMALYAGAFDERITLTIAQESGGGGINSWRVSDKIGTSVEGISNTNYDWFLTSFKQKFNGKTNMIPYDHHELIAMIAPRAFLAFGNPDYVWLGDESGYVSLKAAEEVWKAMGIEDRFGYVIEGGHSHCQASSNQDNAARSFIQKFLHGDNSQNTTVRRSTVNAEYSSWSKAWAGHSIVNDGCGNSEEEEGEETSVSLSKSNAGYFLSSTRPNPVSSGETSFEFSIPERGFVSIDLYNTLGVRVKTIVAEELNAGEYQRVLNVEALPSGVYCYVMNVNGFSLSQRMIIE